ncbi:MAG: flippase-like domain-containing protein [Lentimicrobium sp.]|nr:flippase-like domain-containing protein [Lentimicrobium sp.]
MKKLLRKRIFLLFRFLGIGLFVYILFRVDLSQVADALAKADISFILLGVFFQILVLLSKGVRWHYMNNGKPEWKFWVQSLGRFFESYAIGVVTPARIGEVVKAGHEKGSQNVFNAGIRVMAERGIDIGIFVSLAGLSVLFGDYFELHPVYTLLIIGAGLLFIVISMLLLTSAVFTRALIRLIQNLPGKWDELKAGESRYTATERILIVFLSFFSNFSYFVSCYFLGKASGIDAGFLWVTGAVAISGLLNMLPVTIMGLGTRELVFLYVFKTYAIQGTILAFSFMIVIVAQIGGGLLALLAGQLLLLQAKKYLYD